MTKNSNKQLCHLFVMRCSMVFLNDDARIRRGGVADWFRAHLKSGVPWFKSSTLPLAGVFSIVPSSTLRPRFVNSQLDSLPSVGILNKLCSIYIISLLIYNAHNSHSSAKSTNTCCFTSCFIGPFVYRLSQSRCSPFVSCLPGSRPAALAHSSSLE